MSHQQTGGEPVRHADLSGIDDHGWNEIVVDGRGNIYVNSIGFDFGAGDAPQPGLIAVITGDGAVRQVAGDIEFPNGMAITPDNSTLVVAESFAGCLTAFDIAADGACRTVGCGPTASVPTASVSTPTAPCGRTPRHTDAYRTQRQRRGGVRPCPRGR